MAIAVWTETNMACPYCQSGIRRGKRRFGPGRVICGNCNKEMETGLVDIYDRSKAFRVTLILLDWFFPSYYRGISQPGQLLVMLFHLFIALAPINAIMIAAMVLANGGNPSDAFAMAPFLLFALFHFLWLRRMISETKAYHFEGTVPTWSAPLNAR